MANPADPPTNPAAVVEQVDRDAFHTLPFNADSVDIIYLLARHRLLGIEQGRAEMREEAMAKIQAMQGGAGSEFDVGLVCGLDAAIDAIRALKSGGPAMTPEQIALAEDEKPHRVQLRRTKGWRMPPNTVKVDRTTKWGNPFVPGKPSVFTGGRPVADKRHAFKLYQAIAPDNAELVAAARAELRGKNLACWCPVEMYPEDGCCHADVLLELANSDHLKGPGE